MSPDESVSEWLEGLKDADDAAVQKIWQRYYKRLVGLARRILEMSPRRAADEEDVALSAINSFYRRAVNHEFPRLNDRDDLWKLLMTITAKKACKVRLRERKTQGQLAYGMLRQEELAADEPDPQFAAELADQIEYLLGCLRDDQARTIALLKLEGHRNREIAKKTARSMATVERKLQLIRRIWSRELEQL